jgi:hypothetical protein
MDEIMMKAVSDLAEQYQKIVDLAKKYPNDSELGKQVRIAVREYVNSDINKNKKPEDDGRQS